ncbi:MAG TPA: hypothetical protein VHK01_06350 [Lacipirellulaceae bacterium]|nr:hypothetical protein [Lacipirellulaceae bacterium]
MSLVAFVFFSLACALVAALWVRSYRAEDRASGNYSNSTGVRLYSSRGWVVCSKNSNQKYPWSLELGSDFWLQPGDARLNFSIPSEFFRGAAFASISIPHWFLVLGSVGLVATSWPRKSYRYSLRSLLIATTLIAIVLSLVAAAQHP